MSRRVYHSYDAWKLAAPGDEAPGTAFNEDMEPRPERASRVEKPCIFCGAAANDCVAPPFVCATCEAVRAKYGHAEDCAERWCDNCDAKSCTCHGTTYELEGIHSCRDCVRETFR